MLSRIIKCSASALLVASGWAGVLIAPPGGCRLTVKNDGTAQQPVDVFDCEGDCVAPAQNPCAVDSIVFVGDDGKSSVLWQCECDGQDITVLSNQACDANMNNNGGVWKIVCSQARCANPCTKATLPVTPGSTVFACTCPDV
ncbi:MAG: hypothetical protein KAI24_07190 [Planctomycetes bacterium]|nr:hypothetical protein [Planctomycetota bacterium]